MADTTERLLLQVDAATELLRRHLAEGEQPLERFERRAGKMAETVDGSIGGMGKRFGAFAGLADDAAKRVQESFEASFTQVQRIAATAIKGPTIDGQINLGAEDIRAGAAAAQDQARAFDLIASAAQRAALAEGDTTEATRLFIQATNASRVDAERKAAALLAEAGALERVEIELRGSAEAVDLFVGKHQRLAVAAGEQERLAASAKQTAAAERSLAAAAEIVRAELDPMYLAQKRFNDELDRAEALLAAGILREHEYDAAVARSRATLQAHAQAVAGNIAPADALTRGQGTLRAAMQGLSFQAQDTFTQLSMGANFFQVLAIQGGQAAGQFANVEGKAGSFARFLIGPYGLAITAALLVLGPLTKGMFELGNALDDEIDKLKESAKNTALADRAKKAFLLTEAGAIDDVRALTAEIKKQNDALKSNAELSNIRAKTDLKTLEDQRAPLAKQLEQARAALRATNSTPTGGIAGTNSVIQGQAAERVRALAERLAAVEGSITRAQAAVASTRADLADEAAKRSVDPIAQINRRYEGPDGLIEQAKKRAVAEGTVTTALTRQLEVLRAQQKADVDAAQKRLSAANRTPNNNQIGRTITVSDARSIVASIGGTVTSGTRSTERQAELYSDFLAGRHKGPVAKPGTSDHERGQAVDVAYGPGISIASIKEAFAKQGVALRQIIDEPAQRVIHVAFGKRGPSQETLTKRAEVAERKVLTDDISYTDQERAARQRLLSATRKGADTEEQKEAAASESAQVERDATRRKIADQLAAKKITAAQADHLNALNEATYTQQLQNQIVERATAQIDRGYEAAQADLQSQLAVLRINEDLATTARDRRAIARQILEAEQKLRRQALERTRDTSQDPKAVQSAKDELGRLPTVEGAENRQFEDRQVGELDQYRKRLHAATDDMNDALQSVAVQGFGALESSGAQAIGSAVTNLLHLRGVAGEVIGGVITDLARLAIQKAIVKAIGSSFLGFSEGGALDDVPGFADGGSPGGLIQGPGTGTSDSILALLSGGKGAIRVSTKEFIVNAAATQKHLPLLRAINANQVPGYAQGGYLDAPALPALRSPRLPDSRVPRAQDRMFLDANVTVNAGPEFDAKMESVSLRTVGATAEPIMAGAQSRTIRRLSRPDLPGGLG